MIQMQLCLMLSHMGTAREEMHFCYKLNLEPFISISLFFMCEFLQKQRDSQYR